MAQEYLERLTALMKEATSGRFKDIKLEYKHFFSGAALYANGKICISLTPVGFAIKLPEESRNALLKQKSTKPLSYFLEGPIKGSSDLVRVLSNTRRERKISTQHIHDM